MNTNPWVNFVLREMVIQSKKLMDINMGWFLFYSANIMVTYVYMNINTCICPMTPS